jgi:hypothetical protein
MGDALPLVATVLLLAVLSVGAMVGFSYGRAVGRCETVCGAATVGLGTASYRGGVCRCQVNGQEVTPL